MTDERRLSIADLRYFAVECGKCHTPVEFDLSEATVTALPECPFCGEKREKESLHAKTFHRLYHELKNSGNVMFSFRLPARHSGSR
jgi:hypothetical protein